MALPFTDDELRDAGSEARRLLRSIADREELNLTELIENGWVRDAEHGGRTVIDSRAWALMVALLDVSWQAIDQAERTTWKMMWDVRFAADKARPHTERAFRDKILTALGAAK